MCACLFFFFNDTATTEIYTDGHTLSLHDALPSSGGAPTAATQESRPNNHAASVDARIPSPSACATCNTATAPRPEPGIDATDGKTCSRQDRKSTRLNSSH